MGKNPTERKHSMLTRQTTQSRAIQKTKRVATKPTNNKQKQILRGNKQRLSLQSSRFDDANNENYTANGLDYESIDFADYYCGDEYASSQSIIFCACKVIILQGFV